MKIKRKNTVALGMSADDYRRLLLQSSMVLFVGFGTANAQQDIIQSMAEKQQQAGRIVRQQLASQTINESNQSNVSQQDDAVNVNNANTNHESNDRRRRVQTTQGVRLDANARTAPKVTRAPQGKLTIDGNATDSTVATSRILPDTVSNPVSSALSTPRKQTNVTLPTDNGEKDLSLLTGSSQSRDPFALTTVILGSQNDNTAPALEFTPVIAEAKIPKLRLKGIINTKGEKTALLEVAGYDTYVVKENDAIGLPPSKGGTNVIKIKKIDRLSLIVEVGHLGQVIIVR